MATNTTDASFAFQASLRPAVEGQYDVSLLLSGPAAVEFEVVNVKSRGIFRNITTLTVRNAES